MVKNKLNIQRNIKLAHLTTLKIGGHAEYFVDVFSLKELEEALEFADPKNLRVHVLGEGSNVFFDDKGFAGVIIRLRKKEVNEIKKTKSYVLLTIGAGKNWDELVAEAVKRRLQGIECMSNIPGTVGAAPVQNIGAYGQELSDVFVKLSAYDCKKKQLVTLSKKDCGFGYRTSIFKKKKNKGRYIIFEVVLKLHRNRKPIIKHDSLISYFKEKNIKALTLRQVREAVIKIRRKRHVDYSKVGNAGSFFKNPIVSKQKFEDLQKEYKSIPFYPASNNKIKIPAGWLIESAGWKGKRYKNVGISKKHALVLINPRHKGTAREINELKKFIQKDVFKKFGVKLHSEVQYIKHK